MAHKEKAFIDACHLSLFGRYAFDLSAVDLERLDRVEMKGMLKPYP